VCKGDLGAQLHFNDHVRYTSTSERLTEPLESPSGWCQQEQQQAQLTLCASECQVSQIEYQP
jgi:hypothetical protein